MADPLTSSDVWRLERGWGASPMASPEERKRLYSAGELPMSSGDIVRMAEGRGISPMAGQAEKEAWVAGEVQAGRRPETDLPMAYGGIGERPEATTRRGLRMQQEWDKRYEMMVDQQEAARQADMDEKRYAIDLAREERQRRAGDATINAAYAKEMRDLEIEKQSDRAMKSILGTTLPDGQRTRPINVNDDDAVERIQSVVALNPYGMESQIVKETVSMMLNDALDIRQRGIEAQTATRDQDVKSKVALARDLGAYGMSIADFTENGVVNFEKANEAVGKAYAAGKTAELERAETKEQRGAISDKINSAEKELLKIRARAAAAQKRLETRPNSKDFQTEFDAAVTEQSIMEDEINRLNRALGVEPQRPQELATPQAGGQQPQQRELSQQDQVALNWANANPNDPRSQKIKAKLGVQ